MTTKLENFIKDNIELIELNKFDELFKQLKKFDERIEFASILLNCGIDYHVVNIKKSSRYNVNRFLADLRLSKESVRTIRKGPYSTGQYEVLSSQYMLTLPVLLDNPIPDNVKSEYHIDRTETAIVGAWSPYPQYSNDKTIIIINS